MWESRVGEIILGFCEFPHHGQGGTIEKEKLCEVFGSNFVGLGF